VLNAVFGSSNVLNFDGVDDRVQLTNANICDGRANFTVMCWVKTPSGLSSAYRRIFAKENVLLAGMYGHTMAFLLGSGSGWTHITTNMGTIPSGQWVHVAYVKDGTTRRTYINAVSSGITATAPATVGTSTVNNMIGQSHISGQNYNGQLSDLRIYDYALTAEQISDSKDERLSGNESGLVEYWKLDEGSGSVANGLANNGTIFGATWTEADESFPLYAPPGISYDPTPYDSQTTNDNGLTTLNYQINTIHGLEVTLPGKRRFIMPFQRTIRGLLYWQVMLSDYLATFATDRGNILINSEPENNDANFLIE
jgi:hypothetical protein